MKSKYLLLLIPFVMSCDYLGDSPKVETKCINHKVYLKSDDYWHQSPWGTSCVPNNEVSNGK